MRTLFILFLLIPIIEIYVLIKVGGVIGAVPTIFAVVATAVIGVTLLRQQGYQVLFSLRSKLAVGALPAKEMLEGVMLAVGGAFLLTPGFVTDALGFSLILPVFRHAWLRLAWGKFGISRHGSGEYGGGRYDGKPTGRADKDHAKGDTLEGEFRREDDH